MRFAQPLRLLFATSLLLPTCVGCSSSVETAPATAPADDDGDIATEGMTPAEVEEFEAGEEGE